MTIIGNINLLLCLIYLALAVINIFGGVSIDDSSIFGMTIGALFLCLAQVFEERSRMNFFMNFLGGGFIIISPLLDYTKELTEYFDSNTWMLLSLSVTFLSNFMAEITEEKNKIEMRSKELQRNYQNFQMLKKEVKILKNRVDSINDSK